MDFRIELLPDNITYQVVFLPGQTWTVPNNFTSTAQVTVRVPTGGFTATNIESLVPNTRWLNNSRFDAPSESPDVDYISFGLASLGTSAFQYQAGEELPVFTFQNDGDCLGHVELMLNADPFFPPNSLNGNVGNQLAVLGATSENAFSGVDSTGDADCSEEDECADAIATYHLDVLPDGRFQVAMTAHQDYNYPDNITSTAQITVVAPTGGLAVTQVENLIPNVAFSQNARLNAPSENPEQDYIVFGLTSIGTEQIPYIAGQRIPLFNFTANTVCSQMDICLMQEDDPFAVPNSQSANVGQQLSLNGEGIDVPLCIKDCVACPQFNQDNCPVTFSLTPQGGGEYLVTMTPSVTYTGEDARTSTAQVTIVVPADDFAVANLTSLQSDVIFINQNRHNRPAENPTKDYINFSLSNIQTTNIPYLAGQSVPLFTFTNNGECSGAEIYLMNNDQDPFTPPNSTNANVGMQLTVQGYGLPDMPLCIEHISNLSTDAVPCGNVLESQIDLDRDGVMLWEEMGCSREDFSTENCPNPLADGDDDGILNFQDPDFCTLNVQGICQIFDADDDGFPNWNDIDSDGDGIPDYTENGLPAPLGDDTDNDSIDDAYDPDLTNQRPTLTDTDGDGLLDYLDLDSDNDGIVDNIEAAINPLNPQLPAGIDSDGDGLDDRFDPDAAGTPLVFIFTDSDAAPDHLDIDSDNDGILDTFEGFADDETTPTVNDTDDNQNGILD
ncbi:MAG: hypothetical protein AB8G22_07190, partial [Saprospiraceae bacterium]